MDYSRGMLDKVQSLFRSRQLREHGGRKRLVKIEKYLIARLARPMENRNGRYDQATAPTDATGAAVGVADC